MNRDLRPYYPPNHKDEVLTDGEMRRRAEVAAYMANEQKVKHRLKRIRFVRDRANAEGLLFSPTLLSSFTGTPEERVQIMQDLATIEREDAEPGRRQTQYDDLHSEIHSTVEQSQSSIYPFTHFMPSWPSLSAHEQQYARNTVCAINEAAIAPTREERELYKRAIREINADAQGWHYRGSKVRPMSTGRLRREGLGVPENIWGWGEVAPERRHRVEVEPLTEEQRLMMLTNDREALVVAGLDAPENLLSWGSMTGEERDQIRRDWESLDEQVRMMDGRE
ncbi:hypothetical protein HBI25_187640 [Parastagonospora nodorum]|nr:hypothetical protein HBH51_158070 [Parastagonospora nodorum]KAH3981450.1 hypothetical protein HBH52_087520 [Parastagonospora nodorum]KAH4050981.1 hypothetical protein HBH49_126150 [Parastagonospora nodorum]KAH4093349.1 hypothetical protein HBH46_179460 [Parastagonospora nodorum]KAH4260504.1 hypothetical protein HBI03_126790 [Parastagonospora nodorum]